MAVIALIADCDDGAGIGNEIGTVGHRAGLPYMVTPELILFWGVCEVLWLERNKHVFEGEKEWEGCKEETWDPNLVS